MTGPKIYNRGLISRHLGNLIIPRVIWPVGDMRQIGLHLGNRRRKVHRQSLDQICAARLKLKPVI